MCHCRPAEGAACLGFPTLRSERKEGISQVVFVQVLVKDHAVIRRAGACLCSVKCQCASPTDSSFDNRAFHKHNNFDSTLNSLTVNVGFGPNRSGSEHPVRKQAHLSQEDNSVECKHGAWSY